VKEIKPQSVTVTLDLAKSDSSKGEVDPQRVLYNELYHGQRAAESPEEVYLIGVGAMGDDVKLLEERESSLFEADLAFQEPTMSAKDAEADVRKLFGLPAQPTQAPQPPKPAPTPPTTKPEEKKPED